MPKSVLAGEYRVDSFSIFIGVKTDEGIVGG